MCRCFTIHCLSLIKLYLLFVDRATNVTLQLYILSIDSINEMAMVGRTGFVANTIAMIDDLDKVDRQRNE